MRRQWANYLMLCAVWVLAYFLPIIAIQSTDFYGEYFQAFQAAIPATLIYASFHLSHAWWSKYLRMVLMIQIIHNLGDVLFDDAWQIYDYRQGVLNCMELALLLGAGLPTLIIQSYKARRNADADQPSTREPDSRHCMAKGRQGISGHAR